jgi:hypothetical protein
MPASKNESSMVDLSNNNDRNSKSQTNRFFILFEIWNLFGPILRSGGACNLLFPVYMSSAFVVPVSALTAAPQGPLFPSVVSEKA